MILPKGDEISYERQISVVGTTYKLHKGPFGLIMTDHYKVNF